MDNTDREGTHSCWRIILLLVGLHLASQAKVKLPHSVVSGVIVPHGCEYFTDQAEVLIDQSLLYRLPLRRQKSSTDALGEHLEEGNGVLNVLEVRGGGFSQLQKRRHWRQAVAYSLKTGANKPWVVAC